MVHGGAEDVGHQTHAIPHADLDVPGEDHVPFNANRLIEAVSRLAPAMRLPFVD